MPSADGQAHVCSWRNWRSDGTVTTVIRCVTLDAAPDLYEGRVDFHWWPKPTTSA